MSILGVLRRNAALRLALALGILLVSVAIGAATTSPIRTGLAITLALVAVAVIVPLAPLAALRAGGSRRLAIARPSPEHEEVA
jgi:hypothetical protein